MGLRRRVFVVTMFAVVAGNDRVRMSVVQELKKMVHAVRLGDNQKNHEQGG